MAKPCNEYEIVGAMSRNEREKYVKGYDDGIKELNYKLQEIRKEIILFEVDKNHPHPEEQWFNMGLHKALEVIDKHIAEVE